MKEYARQLKHERELRSWSQEQVAEKIGTTAPNVSRWERGKTFPDTYYRQKLCELFGKSTEELGLIQHDTDAKSKQSTNQQVVAQDSTSSAPVVFPPARNQNRQRMLQKVRIFWINGVLEQSLNGSALVALGLHMQPDAVANPWNLVLQQGSQSAHPLPTGTGIVQVYDDVGGELLILGEPGSGKTTLLLELARELLNRASYDATHPIPVVFNLSSWATKQQPFANWLSEELNTKYQVPRKLARAWIVSDLILPLLDGLDEVSPSSRAACVDAINGYRKEHGLVPVVVCSRSAEYFAQTQQVLLHSAVTVQPLTWQQIENYLESGGEKLASVRVALNRDPELRKLVTTPLMLSVLTLAYHEVPFKEDLTSNSPTTRQRQVFAIYVQRTLRHRGAPTRYTPEQTIRWLTWLARQLEKHNQTEFYIERMQPDWLSNRRLRKLYASRLVKLTVGLIAGLVIGVLYGLFSGIVRESVIALKISHASGLSHWWKYIIFNLNHELSYSLPLGLIVGLVIGLVVGLTCRLDTEIKPTEALVWSWTGRWRRRVAYGLIGIFIGVLSVLTSFGWLELLREMTNALSLSGTGIDVEIITTGGLVDGPVSTLIAGFVGGLVGLIMSGWSSTMLDKKALIKPNQGIRRSVRRGLLVGLIGAFIGVLFVMLAFSVSVGDVGEFAYAPLNVVQETTGQLNTLSSVEFILPIVHDLILGIIFGLTFTLFNGGFASIKHLILRTFLWYAKSTPWNYPNFLDYAAHRLLLLKVGGGYIFVHRLLLDYFASLDTQSTPNEVETEMKDISSAKG